MGSYLIHFNLKIIDINFLEFLIVYTIRDINDKIITLHIHTRRNGILLGLIRRVYSKLIIWFNGPPT